MPSAEPSVALPKSPSSHLSTMETGRTAFGVPFGVAFGVVDALSTLALLEPDLGVMLELRNALTGVETSSFV